VRVLVVEQDDGVASAVSDALTEEWYVVTRASGAQEGLAVASRGRYDAVLTDALGLTDDAPTGADLAALWELAAHAPVVLVTERGWARTAAPASLGVAAIVTRPASMGDVLAAVRVVAGPARP
jgi:two-component system OmpR family response regulator